MSNIPDFRDASASKLMHIWRGEHTLDATRGHNENPGQQQEGRQRKGSGVLDETLPQQIGKQMT